MQNFNIKYNLNIRLRENLTVKNINNHLHNLNIDVVDNKNINECYLNNSKLHLYMTVYGKPAIN